MRAAALALIAALAASPASATPDAIFPVFFDVTGVAGGDVLNVRAEPSASAPIISTLAPTATRVEATAENKGWLRVNAEEGTGWVSARFARIDHRTWQDSAVPEGLFCHGNEPFWSAKLSGDTVTWNTPEEEQRYPRASVMHHWGQAETPRRFIVTEGLTLLIEPSQDPEGCSDMMSDRRYGLDASLIRREGGGVVLYQGCCSIGVAR